MDPVIKAALADVFASINSLSPDEFKKELSKYEQSEFANALDRLTAFFEERAVATLYVNTLHFGCDDIGDLVPVVLPEPSNDELYLLAA